jgi:hypothetical protein
MGRIFIIVLGAAMLGAGCPGAGSNADGACNIDADCPAGEICNVGLCEEGTRSGGDGTDAGGQDPTDSGTAPMDAGQGPGDAGAAPDAGEPPMSTDAGADGGLTPSVDAAITDSGSGEPDGGGAQSTDAGFMDGGSSEFADAGLADAGLVDAGLVDGGMVGILDAAIIADAGDAVDGGDGGDGMDDALLLGAGPPCIDGDNDLHGENCAAGPDCNEGDPLRFDEVLLFVDGDEDGHGINVAGLQCIGATIPTGFVENLDNGVDCNDLNEDINPSATEVCDGLDNDCNGNVDVSGTANICPCEVEEIGNYVYMVCPGADWADGYHTCRSLGYELVKVEDETENLALDTLVDAIFPAADFWIGANDVVTEAGMNGSNFVNADSSPLGYDNFTGLEPNQSIDATDFGSQGEDCVEVRDVGEWNDARCNNLRPFVCKADPSEITPKIVPFPSPLFQDDFNSDTESDPPNQTLWFSDRTGGSADIRIDNGGIRMDTRNGLGSPRTYAWFMPSVADSELTMEFDFEESDTDKQLRLFLKASGGWSTDGDNPINGYALLIGPGNALELRQYVNDANSSLDSATLTTGQDNWKIRFRVQGNQVKARIWKASVGEPALWTLEATDSTVTAPGKFSVIFTATTQNHLHAHLDNVVVDVP